MKGEMLETVEQSEDFESSVERGIKEALLLLKERYEDQEDEEKNLPFHNVEHTKGVIRRTEEILLTIQEADPSLIDNHDIDIARLASAYHDAVQEWEENTITEKEGEFKGFTKTLRRRFAGKNETASSNEAIAFLTKTNENEKLFSDFSEDNTDDASVIRMAIDTTVPGWDPVNKTVMQPNLEKETSLVAIAIGLSDIGVAGMDGPEKFTGEGRALFREENLDVLEAIRNQETDPIPDDKKAYFKSRMVGWLKSQAGFAAGRQARLETELGAIPESARESVTKLFSKFGESIEASQDVANKAEGMSFEKLVTYMGY